MAQFVGVFVTALWLTVLAEPPVDRQYLPPIQVEVARLSSQPTVSALYGAPATNNFPSRFVTQSAVSVPHENFKPNLKQSSVTFTSVKVSEPRVGPTKPDVSRLEITTPNPTNEINTSILGQKTQHGYQSNGYSSYHKVTPLASKPNVISTSFISRKEDIPAIQHSPLATASQDPSSISSQSKGSYTYKSPTFQSSAPYAPSTRSQQHHVPSSQYGTPITRREPSKLINAFTSSSTTHNVPLPSTNIPTLPKTASFDSIQSRELNRNLDQTNVAKTATNLHRAVPARLELLDESADVQDRGFSDPVNYEFAYEVQAVEYGNEFGHREGRQGENAQGEYHVVLPDGRKQIVEYKADLEGYHPIIRYEETGEGIRQNLAALNAIHGPY